MVRSNPTPPSPSPRTLPSSPVLLAVKVLSIWATLENKSGRLHELETLLAIRQIAKQNASYPPILLDNFETTGPYGDHMCFVTEAEGFTLNNFRRSNLKTKFLRLHVAQLIISQTDDTGRSSCKA